MNALGYIDSNSYWVAGYFEETKLGSFQVGDAAEVDFMGFEEKLVGHVESRTRGINSPNATVGTQGLHLRSSLSRRRDMRSRDFSITYQVMGEGPIEAYVCPSATDPFDGDARGLYLAFVQ
jgi:hypothetical protein